MGKKKKINAVSGLEWKGGKKKHWQVVGEADFAFLLPHLLSAISLLFQFHKARNWTKWGTELYLKITHGKETFNTNPGLLHQETEQLCLLS